MKRGDIVTVALSGDYGKPRPALIVQSDRIVDTDSVVFLLISSTLHDASMLRLEIRPTEENGLQKTSQVMVDKVMTARRERIGNVIGHASNEIMLSVTRSLALVLGVGD